MARIPFRLPDIGEGIAEAEIVAWHVAVGDMVAEDDPLADMMTDKATVEMTAPVSGRVVEIGGAVGDMLAVGGVLAVFESHADAAEAEEPTIAVAPAEASQVAAPRPEPEVEGASSDGETRLVRAASSAAETLPSRPGPEEHVLDKLEPDRSRTRVLASPAVRARAKDLGLDLAAVKPAHGDRVRHADLDAYLRYGADGSSRRPEDAIEQVQLTGLRRRIAENMAESKRRIPHFTYVEEVDVTALEALRSDANAARGEQPKLTLLPFLAVAVVSALAEFPAINARYDDEANAVAQHRAVHLGIATQTDAGLMVPVVRDAGSHDVRGIAAEIARLAAAARAGKASREELSGSTITISSLGPLGGIAATPIINRPEVAIVGVNRVIARPAVVDGRIEVRQLMNLSSSFDHRVVDGWEAASFIQAIRRRIETPALLFIG